MFCAEDSLARRESLAATASTCQRWVLVEHPSAWGPRTLLDSSLDEPVAHALRDWALRHKVRLVLIKQPEREVEGTRRAFLVAAGEQERAVERLDIGSPRDLLDLDLDFVPGEGWGIGRKWTDPLYLVCTHGRRDPCCAVQGNPVFNVLHEAFPSQVWKSSHIGGDRFAANLLSLPDGVMLGRLQIDSVIRVVRDLVEGTIDLGHYRGRGFYPFHIQAAEHHLRTERGLVGIDALRSVEWERREGTTRAIFELTDGSRCTVTVLERRADEARRLTCHSEEEARPPEYELISID